VELIGTGRELSAIVVAEGQGRHRLEFYVRLRLGHSAILG
jgi:hypothetical protein